jgi:methylated-DNA-[protein]-cysteine S-methyltransferase
VGRKAEANLRAKMTDRRPRSPDDPSDPRQATLVVLPSELGWIALVARAGTLRHLTFGHPSAQAAVTALPQEVTDAALPGGLGGPLIGRLQAYASGARDEFRDVEVDLGPVTEFQRRVLDRCRRIPYGHTLTYGQLATQAGYPGAARAVGNCMAANPIALIIPCHRVVASSGRLGGYSAIGGVCVKRRLLELEGATLIPVGVPASAGRRP